jgi:Tol biopolymer transport system component
MNMDGSAQTRLTNTTTSESYAVRSADARQIAFVRSGQIWLMKADGSNQQQFTFSTSPKSEIVWWQPKQT